MRGRVRGPGVLVAALALVLAGCADRAAQEDSPAAAGTRPSSSASPSAPTTTGQAGHGHHGGAASTPAPRPLRPGEKRMTVAMPEAYTPSAPNGAGTDDYRCFLLDPGLTQDAFLTGTDVQPGTPSVVHHVILFQVPPDQVAAAEQKDASYAG